MVAIAGLTFAEAVDEVLEAVGEQPAPPDSGTEESDLVYSGIAARAKTFLDREKIRVLSEGWPENTFIAITATIGVPPTDTISLKAAGSEAHRALVLGDSGAAQIIRDMNTGGTTVTSDVTIDAITSLDWIEISPSLRDVIVAATKLVFHRRLIGSLERDPMFVQEYIQAELRAGRNMPRPGLQLPNTQLQVPGTGAPQQP